MRQFGSMRDFVIHILVESDNLMVDTEYKGKTKWKHDAMVLLTAKETIKYMRTTILTGRSLLSRWVLLQADLNDFIITCYLWRAAARKLAKAYEPR